MHLVTDEILNSEAMYVHAILNSEAVHEHVIGLLLATS
jgi:hypothetical protein